MTDDPAFSVLDPAGAQASRILDLWDIFFAVTTGAFVAVLVALVVVLARGMWRRRREGDGEPSKTDKRQSARLFYAVAAAVGLTTIGLVALLVASVRTGVALASIPEGDAVVVEITGHQWWWEIEYLSPAPSRIVTTANELHLPTGKPVILELTSADVIHSFWVPSLHGKRDLIPGRVNRTWIRIDEPGTYRGQCAEFCGLQHAKMALLVVAEPPEAFERWLDHQREPARAPASRRAMRGREVFLTGPCVLCHQIRGEPAGGTLGPDLTHVASRATIAAGWLPNTRGHLAGWLADPQRIKPGVRMPPTLLPAADRNALLEYLETLR